MKSIFIVITLIITLTIVTVIIATIDSVEARPTSHIIKRHTELPLILVVLIYL